MQNKLCALVLFLSLCVACVVFAEPIYVDGSGTELGNTAPPQSSATAAPSNNNNGSIIVDGTGSEVEDVVEDSDTESEYVWPGYEDTDVIAQWNGSDVLVTALGTFMSAVKLNGQSYNVKTSLLTFTTTAAAGEQLAIISAPKSGKATMFYKPSSKGDVVVKCDTGAIVPVLETTKSYAKVNYQGAVGYVRRTSLTFVSPVESGVSLAYVAYKGNVKSGSKINVRMNPSSKSRVVSELKCGTLVAVIGVEDGGEWTEIEGNGFRCHILSEYLVNASGN